MDGDKEATSVSSDQWPSSTMNAISSACCSGSTSSKLSLGANLETKSVGEDSLDLGPSIADYEPNLQFNLDELTELVNKLEDMTSVIRQHVRNAKKVIRAEGQYMPKTNWKLTFVFRFLLPIVVCLQAMMVTILSLSDHTHLKHSGQQYVVMVEVSVGIIQFVCIVTVICSTVMLTKQMFSHRASTYLLAQTYISTVFVFTGIYVLSYRLKPQGWTLNSKLDGDIAIFHYIRMLYLSVSSSTLCGSSDTKPISWYNTLLVCFQDVLNFVYFASILSQVIGNYQTYTVKVARNYQSDQIDEIDGMRSIEIDMSHQSTDNLIPRRQAQDGEFTPTDRR
ncbi:Uncharacterised protein g4388 [Pycnogonum litorale]